ncbi:Ribonuclease P protein subunit p14 [Bulinus truncatus]|nr:Ribonuclease P protein subunit p14 [Bulinus truncatus]
MLVVVDFWCCFFCQLYKMEVEQKTCHLPALISDKQHPFVYLKVKLSVENDENIDMTPVRFKFLIMQAVRETLGEVGASTTIDVLKLQNGNLAILRVPSRLAETVWAALTLYGSTQNEKRCSFVVLQASAFLMALAVNSREIR